MSEFKDPRDKTPRRTKAERLAADGAPIRNKIMDLALWADFVSVVRRVEAGEGEVKTRFFFVNHTPATRTIASGVRSVGDGMATGATISVYGRGESPAMYLLEAVQLHMTGKQQVPFKTIEDVRAFVSAASS